MKHPGKILRFPDDDQFFLVKDFQPLLQEKRRVIMYLVDEQYNKVPNENGTPKMRIIDFDTFNKDMLEAALIGYVG